MLNSPFQFFIFISFLVNLTYLINLGLIESDSDLVNVCQTALNEARVAGKCSNEEIQLSEGIKFFFNLR
ncbi:unnamed protein product [Meloidogyne enterolobii]|uniref:Uncharacterized protein n=1 Tax=Meloidogyne enterolobii TaxID=390850 RepID=A0ACB1A258_MELEN